MLRNAKIRVLLFLAFGIVIVFRDYVIVIG